ncbi:XrtA/PEP-CTERM system-associated ATPase [Sphingoaurantiacus capsulatus]|uniref:XrtA/PEP-CTERM system-associated ATPase n=1 Tax=Sphingoaurantiacus capsulatus TaxID=1771310 RepID=A0ABV7XFI1_9SPHN
MYTDFYELTGRPFQLTPDPHFYFDTETHRKAMAYLSYGLSQGEGFVVITGDVGTGKTTLVGHVMETVDRSKLVVAKIVTTQLDADSMVKMVATAFAVPVDNADKVSVLNRLEAFLRAQYREGRRVLLIVDEAQNLPIAALEELRMLSNFQEGHQALLQTVLLGQPEFRDNLNSSPVLEQLRQRIIASHHLEPMSREELPEYVAHRLTLCGWNGRPTFTQDAFDTMYDYSGGVPRRLNNLASRVLLFGALEQRDQIDGAMVAEVVEDLRDDSFTGPAPAPAPLLVGGDGTVNDDLARRLAALEAGSGSHGKALRQIVDLLDELLAADPAPAE